MARELMALSLQQHQFLAAFGEAQEQRQQRHAHVQPRREAHDIDQRHARGHAQHEARRHDEHIDDDDVLEFERVGQIEHRVEDDDDAEGGIQRERRDEREQPERDRRDNRNRDGQLAGRNGPILLLGMLAIGLHIGNVVDDVNRAGNEAQQHKADDGLAQRRLEERAGHEEFGVEDDGGKDEDVFGQPLPGTHGLEQGAEDGEHEAIIQ